MHLDATPSIGITTRIVPEPATDPATVSGLYGVGAYLAWLLATLSWVLRKTLHTKENKATIDLVPIGVYPAMAIGHIYSLLFKFDKHMLPLCSKLDMRVYAAAHFAGAALSLLLWQKDVNALFRIGLFFVVLGWQFSLTLVVIGSAWESVLMVGLFIFYVPIIIGFVVHTEIKWRKPLAYFSADWHYLMALPFQACVTILSLSATQDCLSVGICLVCWVWIAALIVRVEDEVTLHYENIQERCPYSMYLTVARCFFGLSNIVVLPGLVFRGPNFNLYPKTSSGLLDLDQAAALAIGLALVIYQWWPDLQTMLPQSFSRITGNRTKEHYSDTETVEQRPSGKDQEDDQGRARLLSSHIEDKHD